MWDSMWDSLVGLPRWDPQFPHVGPPSQVSPTGLVESREAPGTPPSPNGRKQTPNLNKESPAGPPTAENQISVPLFSKNRPKNVFFPTGAPDMGFGPGNPGSNFINYFTRTFVQWYRGPPGPPNVRFCTTQKRPVGPNGTKLMHNEGMSSHVGLVE